MTFDVIRVNPTHFGVFSAQKPKNFTKTLPQTLRDICNYTYLSFYKESFLAQIFLGRALERRSIIQEEVWRPFPPLPHILVSDQGNVYNEVKGRMMHQTVNTNNHRRIFITNRYVPVHHLVWVTFSGPVPAGRYVRHIDRDPSNNAYGNLEIKPRA